MTDHAPQFPFRAIVDHPPVIWPGDARVAVWVIPNIEHFHLDQPGPLPDVRNYSRRDYGNRVGIWRLMDTLSKHDVKGTVAFNGEVGQHYPRIMEEAVNLDWELMGHGLTNSRLLTEMDAAEEEEETIYSVKAIIEGYGKTMAGWLGPGLCETWQTLDFLKAAGCSYVADWVNDDLPYAMNNGLYSIPYSIELNDMPLFNMPSISNEEFLKRICDAFDVLYEEGAKGGRVMGLALHPFLIGTPSRIKILDKALAYMRAHEKVWFARGHEIIEAYRTQMNQS